jgi:tetratricopeptide (TPR) repeat protein
VRAGTQAPGEIIPDAAQSTATEADVAMTERRYLEAAERFGQAANYVPSRHASEKGGYLLRQADALYQQGDERGDNDALKSSIGVCRRALGEYPRSQAPLDWATTQNNLGNALRSLGERESGTARLEEAVAALKNDRSLGGVADCVQNARRRIDQRVEPPTQ